MMWIRIAALAALAFSATAHAQVVRTVERPLVLVEVRGVATEHNPQIAVSLDGLEVLRTDVTQDWQEYAGRLPDDWESAASLTIRHLMPSCIGPVCDEIAAEVFLRDVSVGGRPVRPINQTMERGGDLIISGGQKTFFLQMQTTPAESMAYLEGLLSEPADPIEGFGGGDDCGVELPEFDAAQTAEERALAAAQASLERLEASIAGLRADLASALETNADAVAEWRSLMDRPDSPYSGASFDWATLATGDRIALSHNVDHTQPFRVEGAAASAGNASSMYDDVKPEFRDAVIRSSRIARTLSSSSSEADMLAELITEEEQGRAPRQQAVEEAAYALEASYQESGRQMPGEDGCSTP